MAHYVDAATLRIRELHHSVGRNPLIDKTPAELFEPPLAFHNHPLLQ